MTESTEPRFTLDEARSELARRECLTGHDLSVVETTTLAGTDPRPIGVKCDRCGKAWWIPEGDREAVTVRADDLAQVLVGVDYYLARADIDIHLRTAIETSRDNLRAAL